MNIEFIENIQHMQTPLHIPVAWVYLSKGPRQIDLEFMMPKNIRRLSNANNICLNIFQSNTNWHYPAPLITGCKRFSHFALKTYLWFYN